MRGELVLSTTTLFAFLLTLARVSGVFIFVPMPGLRNGFEMARVALSLVLTLALFPYWPHLSGPLSAGGLVLATISEAALGIGIGLAVAFVLEAFEVAAQIMGLQAGYAYASSIDPVTQADSSVLATFAQLTAGLLFFVIGLDRQVLQLFADSLAAVPAGSFVLTKSPAQHLLGLGVIMFSSAIRLAVPVVAVLIMVDISLALMGRINAQLQLLTLAFPIKMLMGLSILSWILIVTPTILRSELSTTLSHARALFEH